MLSPVFSRSHRLKTRLEAIEDAEDTGSEVPCELCASEETAEELLSWPEEEAAKEDADEEAIFSSWK